MSEQRDLQRKRIPTDEVVKQAATFPRDRLGEPLDIDPGKYDQWLELKLTAARLEASAEAWNAGVLYAHGRHNNHGGLSPQWKYDNPYIDFTEELEL